MRTVEIMDTTLRDGEQTSGVSFSTSEKLTLAKLLLEELGEDRIEIASARVSKGELHAVQEITEWAQNNQLLHRVEVLTFLDEGKSLEWMQTAGAEVQNLLTKGSLNHLTHQLKQKPSDHFKKIEESVYAAQSQYVNSNLYLEDWSNGMRNSKDYVFDYLDCVQSLPIKRVLLPDTLGVLNFDEAYDFVQTIVQRYPKLHFDFHGHNDYDLGVANATQAVKAGIHGLHLTLNGMGERAGNVPLASMVAVINDFIPDATVNIDEKALYRVSKLVETFTGFRIPANEAML